MASKDLDILLSRRDLVCQKNTEGIHLTTNEGEVIQVFRDGCAVVALYNALRLSDFQKSFEDFTSDLAAKKCVGNSGINWKAFNNLNYDLQFAWMQDAELQSCDQIDIPHLRDWMSSGSVALVKVQSLYSPDRRHFMVAVGIDEENVKCLEASSASGVPTLRDIAHDELLGLRYFTTMPKYVKVL